MTEIQSAQLKSNVKRDETARFVRARLDPQFSRLVRVRHLGPEHLENQQRLRRATHGVRERMQELEEQLMLIKKRVSELKLGRMPLAPPSLDSILRASNNITSLATARLGELDRMATELTNLRPDITHNVRESSLAPKTQPLQDIVDLQDVLPAVHSHADVPEPIEYRETLRTLHDALLVASKEPLLTRSTGSPIMARARTLPQKQAPPPQSAPEPEISSAQELSMPRVGNFLATTTPSGKFEPRTHSTTTPRAGDQSLTFEGLIPPQPLTEGRRLTLEDLGDDSGSSDNTYEEDYDDPEYESEEEDE